MERFEGQVKADTSINPIKGPVASTVVTMTESPSCVLDLIAFLKVGHMNTHGLRL